MSLRGGCSSRRSHLLINWRLLTALAYGASVAAKKDPRNDLINFQQSRLLPKQKQARTRMQNTLVSHPEGMVCGSGKGL